MKSITVSSKNQIVVPRDVRDALGISSGDKLVIKRLTNTEVVLKKEPTYRELIGTLPSKDSDPVARIRKLRDQWV